MAPLSTTRRKEACELVIIAKCDGINTLASKELRLIKRYMQEIGVESLEEAYKQALVEKKTPEDQQKSREAKENNLNKPKKPEMLNQSFNCAQPEELLENWPEGSFEKFAYPLRYKDFVDKCKANPNHVALFKEGLTRHTASDTALRVRNARYRAFAANKGHFEARILPCDESYSVYVKYVPQKAA